MATSPSIASGSSALAERNAPVTGCYPRGNGIRAHAGTSASTAETETYGPSAHARTARCHRRPCERLPARTIRTRAGCTFTQRGDGTRRAVHSRTRGTAQVAAAILCDQGPSAHARAVQLGLSDTGQRARTIRMRGREKRGVYPRWRSVDHHLATRRAETIETSTQSGGQQLSRDRRSSCLVHPAACWPRVRINSSTRRSRRVHPRMGGDAARGGHFSRQARHIRAWATGNRQIGPMKRTTAVVSSGPSARGGASLLTVRANMVWGGPSALRGKAEIATAAWCRLWAHPRELRGLHELAPTLRCGGTDHPRTRGLHHVCPSCKDSARKRCRFRGALRFIRACAWARERRRRTASAW